MAVYEGFTVYGPYTRKDGRQLVVLTKHNTNGCIIERHTVSYPKYIVEKHINRYLLPNETVDHIDCNFRNNDLSNLRIIDRKVHCKSHTSSKLIIVKQCAICDTLYNAGYRVVPDGAVILTPEERDEEMKELARLNRVETELQELNIKYYNEAKDLRREVAELKTENERLKEVIADQNELCWNCKKSVKEFAEKLRKKVISLNVWEFGEIDIIDVDDIDELLKEYEVEE